MVEDGLRKSLNCISRRVIATTIISWASLTATTSTNAGGFPVPAMAMESTQWLNNFELAASGSELIAQTKTQLDQYQNQLLQYKEMINAGKRLQGSLSGLTVNGIASELTKVRSMKNSLTSLNNGLQYMSANLTTRLNEAQIRKMSWAEYVQMEGENIRRKNDRAIARLEAERQVYDSIEEDYAMAKAWGDQISETEGVHQSMGLLNTQMNRLIQQNARIVQLAAQAQGGDKANAEVEEAANRDAANKALGAISARRITQTNAMTGAIRNMQLNSQQLPSY